MNVYTQNQVPAGVNNNGGNTAVMMTNKALPTRQEYLQVAKLLAKVPHDQLPFFVDFLERAGYSFNKDLLLPAEKDGSSDDDTLHLHEFCKNVLARASWHWFSFRMVHDLYKRYLEKNHPGVKPLGKNQLMTALRPILGIYGWEATGKKRTEKTAMRPAQRIACREPLFSEFELEEYLNFSGNDATQCIFR